MQTDNAKQGSGLKKIVGWIIGTIAAWAVTKMFDSYYDVSLFSSMYAAIGAWLGHTIPVHLWLFWVVVAVSSLAGALGVWSFLIKRLEVGAAKAERDKAYEKAREVIEKNKAANKKLDAAELELKITRKKLEATESELKAAQAKIADLQTPKVQPLNEHQRIVLAGITVYDNADKDCNVKDLSQKIKFTMVQTESAVDLLVKHKLVNEWYTSGGRSVSLTPDGREYVLHPDFDMSHLPL